MDVVYMLGTATAADVHERLDDAPTYTTVRGLLRVLERKGHLAHTEEGPRYVYRPTAPRDEAGLAHLRHVVRTFFDGSATNALAALLGHNPRQLASEDLERLEALIRTARAKKPR